jgi:menaquinone-dependent protoporphyrinogen oxidase
MSSVLVVYASTHGHTAKVAQRIAEAVRGAGADTTVVDVRDAADVDPARHDTIVVGGSIHRGHHQRELACWVKHHDDALASRPSALFSVSLTAAEDTDEARTATERCIDEFVEDTGWKPQRSIAIAGALQYREYNIHTRVLMRLIMKHGGRPTDTSHDYVYTDWDAVDRFGRDCAALAAHAVV